MNIPQSFGKLKINLESSGYIHIMKTLLSQNWEHAKSKDPAYTAHGCGLINVLVVLSVVESSRKYH